MNQGTEFKTCVAALRPWPFGPPLRGRAMRSDAGGRVRAVTAPHPRLATASVGHRRRGNQTNHTL